MKKAYALEMLILFLAGCGGIIIGTIERWYFGLAFGMVLFSACSYLVGLLKKEVLKEYKYAISQKGVQK